ncbi:hypothetical protein GGI20_003396 [Coemansia sp. BCRC 34301]|nr:hypothetical protein GGI20_003396 [Coemansia sp. BCRC 34301]
MGRKRSNTAKKSKSKRSSTNTSPTPTPADIGASALTESVAAVPEPTTIKVAGHTGAAEEPELSSDNGKYAVDVTAELTNSGADAATEEQLEGPIVLGECNSDEQQAIVVEDNSNDDQHQLHVPNHAARVSDSVNMEDSQAELLSNNMDDSLYRRSSIDHSVCDELHALESKTDSLACLADGSVDVAAAAADISDSNASRPYVVSPSAFVGSSSMDELADVVYWRPDSVTEPTGVVGDVQETAESGAAAVASIVSSLVEAVATAGLSVSTHSIAREAVESSGELIGEHDLYSSIGQVSGGRSIAESYIHVDNNDCEHIEEQTDDLNCESSVCEPEADEQQQGSEQVERVVSEVMDTVKESAKDAANKASDAVHDAGKKADRAASNARDVADDISGKAKKAPDAAADATNDATSKAKDLLDNASKSVRDAAASANDKAHDAMNRARESGEKLAKKAKEEATEAEKAVRRQAKETPPATLQVLGIVAVALAAVSGYYFRLPGRQNQQIGFAGGVASAVIGLGTLATVFVKRNA